MSTSQKDERIEPTPPTPSSTPTTRETTDDLADDAAELAFFNNKEASRSNLPAAQEDGETEEKDEAGEK